jgi:hypothetical protein
MGANQKKCLTSFFNNDIGLKNFNFIVFFLHKFRGRKEVRILGVLWYTQDTKFKEEEKR